MPPVYEYACKAGHTTEVIASIKERKTSVTCSCGKGAHRVLSATRTDFEFADRRRKSATK